MLRSDICGYIVVKGTITVEGNDDDEQRNKKTTLKNNAPFRSYI